MNEQAFYGALVRGDLRAAIDLLPPDDPRRAQYETAFAQWIGPSVSQDAWVQSVLNAYHAYYCDAFYHRLAPADAEKRLLQRLNALSDEQHDTPDEAEAALMQRMAQRGLRFLGGRTGGFYGPYIWAQETLRTDDVPLPGGAQPFSVRMLDGFLHKSWLDAISFGAVSTGGWAGEDGIICCIADCYETNSEAFRVSLLCHEAQHVRDKARHPAMTAAHLEYRAKLVELICSTQRDLLPQFRQEAGETDGHALAAKWICDAFSARTTETTQQFAQKLLEQDEEKWNRAPLP